ncbi:hypothetical protein AB4472_09195 [Vibrio lentus]
MTGLKPKKRGGAMNTNVPIRLHYCSEKYHEYQSRKALLSVNGASLSADLEARLEQNQLTLSVEATNYLLANLPHAYFDYRVDIIHANALPTRERAIYP